MSTGFAGKMMPYLSYFLYAQIVLLALAALMGAVLIIRRILTQQPLEGDPAYTKERIALELTTEITRLRDLRNRIFPGFEATKEGGAVEVTAASAIPLTDEDKARIQKELDEKYGIQIKDLEAKIAELEAALKAAQSAQNGDGTMVAAAPASGEAAEALAREKAAFEDEKILLKSKVETLEKTLTEYQIFENDIALVKKFKTENEELRKQLSATPQVTEEDIASLFTAMSVPGAPANTVASGAPAAVVPPVTIPAAAPSPTPEPVTIAATPAVAPTPEPVAPVSAIPVVEAAPVVESAPAPAVEEVGLSLDDLLRQAEMEAELAKPVPEEGFVTDPVSTGPEVGAAGNLSEGDIEALAQTDQNSDDKLMAEFQKILGGENSKT